MLRRTTHRRPLRGSSASIELTAQVRDFVLVPGVTKTLEL